MEDFWLINIRRRVLRMKVDGLLDSLKVIESVMKLNFEASIVGNL